MVAEKDFQSNLIEELKVRFPGAIVVKNDSKYMQGIPDLTIFYNSRWATLEVKKSGTAKVQPNQEYYVNIMRQMSYSAFIYPENKEEILNEMERALRA